VLRDVVALSWGAGKLLFQTVMAGACLPTPELLAVTQRTGAGIAGQVLPNTHETEGFPSPTGWTGMWTGSSCAAKSSARLRRWRGSFSRDRAGSSSSVGSARMFGPAL